MDNQLKARMLVVEFYNEHVGEGGIGRIVERPSRNGDDPSKDAPEGLVPEINIDDVYVVTFSYILRSWKALCSTMVMDDMVYELTYNAEKKETYVDAYKKVLNVAVKDDPIGTLREKLMGNAR